MKTAVLQAQSPRTTCSYIQYDRSCQSECPYDINNNQKLSHVRHTYLLQRNRQLIYSMFVLFSPFHISGTMIRHIKPHLWMWSCTLFLITSKLLQCHDIIWRKSPLHPLYCPLFGQLHHMGLPVFTPQLVGTNIHMLFYGKAVLVIQKKAKESVGLLFEGWGWGAVLLFFFKCTALSVYHGWGKRL